MLETYDTVMIGGKVVGASLLLHLARLGCSRELLTGRDGTAGGSTVRSWSNLYDVPSQLNPLLGAVPGIKGLQLVDAYGAGAVS